MAAPLSHVLLDPVDEAWLRVCSLADHPPKSTATLDERSAYAEALALEILHVIRLTLKTLLEELHPKAV